MAMASFLLQLSMFFITQIRFEALSRSPIQQKGLSGQALDFTSSVILIRNKLKKVPTFFGKNQFIYMYLS
jgi:hypothetical protein